MHSSEKYRIKNNRGETMLNCKNCGHAIDEGEPYRYNSAGDYWHIHCENTLPLTKGDQHQELCKKLNDTFRKKNEDYGDSFGKQFAEYGELSAAIRLEDKLARFKQLIKNQAKVKDESKIDTLLDMANYAIMTVMELEK
jgi:hypothetical protein